LRRPRKRKNRSPRNNRAIGVGIGYGLDVLFGTMPWFLVPFTLLGFAAGVNVMLKTAKELQEENTAETAEMDEGN